MTCIETRDLFSALADDALTPNERAALDAHLAGCAECRRELAGLLRTVKLVRAMDPGQAPPGFVDRVLAAAQPAPSQRRATRDRRLRPWPMLPLSAAALLLIGGLAVLLFRGSPEQQRAAQSQPETPSAPSSDVAAPRIAPPPAIEPPKNRAESKNSGEPARSETNGADRAAAQPAETAVKSTAPSRDSAAARERELQQHFSPPAAPERRDAKRELSDRGRDTLAPSVGGHSAAAPSAPPPSVGATTPPAGATISPAIAAAKAQRTPQTSPLSRTGPMTGIAAAPPDVTARLRVSDISGAERALIDLATRVGGRQSGRRIDGGRLVVELAVPRESYAEFVRDAATLGAVSIETQATERPLLAVAVTVSN
jgi:hypothetical protein